MRKLLGSTLPFVMAMAVALGGVVATGFVIGRVRQSQDVSYCKKSTPTVVTLKGKPEPVPPEQVTSARAACEAERRRQRGILGAVWRTGGEQMASCGIEWGRYQQLSDTDPAGAQAAITAPYGMTGQIDASSQKDQQHFINACLAKKRTTH